MKIGAYLFYIFLLLGLDSSAQTLSDQILMTIAGKDVTAGEFIRMFNKSSDTGKNQGNIDEYLQQFIVFKLKVADATNAGIDSTRSFREELNGYRNQLAQNYLTDVKVKEKFLQKMYQRSLSEINGWHILVACPEGTTPADTLKAYKKAEDIRERIVNGESFEQVARGTSDDPSVKVNGGNLGYFTAFQMIMPFEDAAYLLRKGEISAPVRTPYGYHIIRVADKRPSRGKIRVAIIMKASPPGTTDADEKKAEEAIKNISDQLQQGASFAELAKKYSDHKESAVNGGKLEWFGTGEIIPEISEAAFALTDTGKYTKPVRTIYGWFIIRLLSRKAPGTFEESRSYLESRLNQSYLNSLSRKAFTEKLKKEYSYRVNQAISDWFVKNTDTLVIQGKSKYNKSTMPSGNIYTFADQRMSAREFASFIEKRGPIIMTKDPQYFINQSVDASLSDRIIKYENSNLEKKYPEFRYLMNEFHDGILLFEISGRKVWNKVTDDSAGLRNYYEVHKNEYLTKRGIDATIYIFHDAGHSKSFYSTIRKCLNKHWSDSIILKRFNGRKDSVLTTENGKWFRGDNPEIDKIDWTEGTHETFFRSLPSLVLIKKEIEPESKPFNEVQGEVMTKYQDMLENEWIRQLKEKYSVKVDGLVFDKIKKSIQK
jgi:peptidyl-prolyl cis-trans isomerase SurA